MTSTMPEFAEWIDSFDRRLHELEQQLTSPAVMGGGDGIFPGGVVIGGVPVTADDPDQVTGVTATPGTFYDEIFCDVEWTEAATGPDAVSFDIELALKTAGPTYTTISIESTAGTAFRFRGLQPNTNYGVRVLPVTNLGLRPAAMPAWTDFTTGVDLTAPPALADAPTVGRGATTVIVKFVPFSAAQAFDVANGRGIYHVQIDTAAFPGGATSPNMKEKYTNDQVTGFNDVLTQGTWYARVRAIDSSGNVGAWSPVSTGQNAGAVDGAWAYSLNASEITTGTLSASRIGSHTLPVDSIITSTLTSTTITLGSGGRIDVGAGTITIGNPTVNGILQNSGGIYAYGSSLLTFSIDASNGNVTMKGALTAGSSITGSDMYAGTINGTTINGAVINVGTPPAEGLRFNADGFTSYARPNYVFKADRDADYNIGNWTQWFNTNLSRSTTHSDKGIASIRAQAQAAGWMGFYLVDYTGGTTGMFPASAGQTWTARIRSRAGSVARQVFLEIRFYSAAGALLQVDTGVSTLNSTTEFVEIAPATGTAPASTAKVGIIVQIISAGSAGELHYFGATRLTKASDGSYTPFRLDSSGSLRIVGGQVSAETFRTFTGPYVSGETIVLDGASHVELSSRVNLYTTSTAAYVAPAEIVAKEAGFTSTTHGSLRITAPYEGASSTGADRANILLRAGGPVAQSLIDLNCDTVNLNAEVQIGSHGIHGTYAGTQAAAIIGRGGNAHTFDWDGGGNAIVFYVDLSEILAVQWDAPGGWLNFYWGGGLAASLSGSKDFTIPHPLDDERWLRHSCIEGPEIELLYDGVSKLHDGIAWIELPAYFESMARKERRKIQITVEDDGSDDFFAPRYSKIENGRFRVRGPRGSNAEFSWSVTAIRKDIPMLDPEPKKSEVDIASFGPYTYLKPKEFVSG